FDTGCAPNPLWGYCTLAICTPNHQGVRLESGDWIMGHTSREEGHKLVYAMEISEVLDYAEYYTDPRFEKKKPRFDRTWREACGDNIYYCEGNSWKQAPSKVHRDREARAADTKYHKVFMAKRFYYFGTRAQNIRPEFRGLIRDRQGCKCSHSPTL